MSERQRRSDLLTANAVARGLNILFVRDSGLAERYMAHKRVPRPVILRVLAHPELRRQPSPEQAISEAITPTPPSDAL